MAENVISSNMLHVMVQRSTLLRWLHYGVIAFGVFLLLQGLIVGHVGGEDSSWGKPVKNIDEMVTASAALICMIVAVARRRLVIHRTIDVLLLFFFLTGIASSISADVPESIWIIQLFLYLKAWIVYFVLANLTITEDILRRYARVFGAIGVVVVCAGCVDWFHPETFRKAMNLGTYVEYRNGIPSVKSIFVHPGVMGWFCSFIGLYFFGWFMIFRRPSHFILATVMMFGTVLSMRRKSLIGILLGIVSAASVLSPRWRRIYLACVAGGLLLGGAVLWPTLTEWVEKTRHEYLARPMDVGRNVMYIRSVAVARDYFPFGAGFGRYGSWMSSVNYSPLYDQYKMSEVYGLSRKKSNFLCDTFWPMVLGETGFIGLFLYSAIMATLLIHLIRLCRHAIRLQRSISAAFLLGTTMMFVESLVESFAQSLYMGPPFNMFIFGAVGLAMSVGRSLHTQEVTHG